MSDISTAYYKAKALVEQGRLRIIHIDAPPRTISSAFQIALTQGADGHLYEPFRHNGNAPDVLGKTSQDVLDLYDEINKQKAHNNQPSSDSSPVVITIKELAQFLKDEEFAKWLTLVGGWVSIVRSPNTQMQSFMTRSILNGTHFSQEELNKTRDALRETLGHEPTEYEMVSALSEEFRVKRGRKTGPMVVMPHKLDMPGFNMWGSLSRHFEEARMRPDLKTAVVDGTALCAQPEVVMRRISGKLDLPFSDKMVSGWEKASGKNLMPDVAHDLKSDAWVVDAVTTRGLVLPQNQPPPLSMFTPTVRRHVEAALEFFMDFANSGRAILPRKADDIQALLSTKVPDGVPFGVTASMQDGISTFELAQPITAYAIALSMHVKQNGDALFKQGLIDRLRVEHYEKYRDSFQIMDYRQRAIDQAPVAALA